MSQPTRDELLKRLADAQAEQEAVTMALIVTELDNIYSGLGEAEEAQAGRLGAAIDALGEPLSQLTGVDAKIAAAQDRCAGLRQELARLDGDDDDDDAPGKMAAAKMHLAEWEARVTRLRSKRDFADSGFQPLYEQRDSARKALGVVQAAKRRVLAAMLDPFGDPLAQQTEAYTSFRAPMLGPVLLQRDLESPEWDQALEQLREWCRRSGYRTDDLPSEAEQIARALAAPMADALATPPDPVPSGQDILAMDAAKMVNDSLPPSVIEDHRNTPPVPRNLRVESWRQVPTLGDLGVR